MANEKVNDFVEEFPEFDPSKFEDSYPSIDEFPGPYWAVAMGKVYEYELYQLARSPEHAPEFRQLAREAWEAIEANSEDVFVCDLAGRLVDCALSGDDPTMLTPMNVSVLLSVILWAAFRDGSPSEWTRHVLHEAVSEIDLESPSLTAAAAFLAGWAAGRVNGELGERPVPKGLGD